MKSFIQKCDWEITTNCNLNCKHCLINHHPKKELSTKECFLIIDLLKKLGCNQINFTGGEALIKNDFFKILEYSNKKGMVNNLFTNGTQINSKNIDKIKKNVNYVGISLEGLQKENDFVRGKNSYKETIACLNLLKKNKILFGIYITINKKNNEKLGRLLRLIIKFNPQNISINELVLKGRAKENKNELFFEVDKKKVVKTIKKFFPNEKFKKESGCVINPKNIFLTSEGKFYFCTETRQCKREKYLGSFIPPKFHKYTEFLENFSKKDLPKECPYLSYASKHITLNFLTGEKCPYLN